MSNEIPKPFLPFEIVINILKRLPVKSIHRFHCVCKDWRDLFKTPSFIIDQVHHSVYEEPCLLVHSYNYNYGRPFLRLLDRNMETIEVLSIPTNECFSNGWRIIGSCNGFLCIEGWSSGLVCLWNPGIREVWEIPINLNRGSSVFGFGFSSKINDYKIVRFSEFRLGEDGLEYSFPSVEVYSLRGETWKEVEFGGLANISVKSTNGVGFDGTLAWLGVQNFSVHVLICFDIVSEVFTTTVIPSTIVGSVFPTTLGVYKNTFAIFGHQSGSHCLDIWVMEKVAGESGNSFACNEKYGVEIFSYALDVSCIWGNEIVCCDKEREAGVVGKPKYHLKMFSLTDERWKEFHNISSAHDCCDCFNYAGSLLSIRNNEVQLPSSEV